LVDVDKRVGIHAFPQYSRFLSRSSVGSKSGEPAHKHGARRLMQPAKKYRCPGRRETWREDMWRMAQWSRRPLWHTPAAGRLRSTYRIWTPAILHMAERWMSLCQQSGLPLKAAVRGARISSIAITGLVEQQLAIREMVPPTGGHYKLRKLWRDLIASLKQHPLPTDRVRFVKLHLYLVREVQVLCESWYFSCGFLKALPTLPGLTWIRVGRAGD
jgi:hypothetical protein